jgi:hypothetical protein
MKQIIIIFVLALFSLSISSYRYGIGDQLIDIPYIKYLLNPTLYPGDQLIPLLEQKASYFWPLFSNIFKITGIEYGFFILQLISLFFFLYMVWRLTYLVTTSQKAAYIAVLLFIIAKYSFGYSSLFSYSSFIPRNFTIGFILWTIVLFLSNKQYYAFFLLGLLSNLHVISIIPVLISFGVYLLFFSNFKALIKNILLYLIGASPVIYKFLSNHGESGNQTLNAEYLDYYNSVLTPFYIQTTLHGYLQFYNALLIIVFTLIALKFVKLPDINSLKLFKILTVVSALLVIVSVVFENSYPIPFFIQLQMGRSGVYSLLVFSILLALALSRMINNSHTKYWGLIFTLIAVLLPFTVLLTPLLLINKWPLRNKIVMYIFLIDLFLISLAININELKQLKDLKMELKVKAEVSDNSQAQDWLRNNTDTNAVLLAHTILGDLLNLILEL